MLTSTYIECTSRYTGHRYTHAPFIELAARVSHAASTTSPLTTVTSAQLLQT